MDCYPTKRAQLICICQNRKKVKRKEKSSSNYIATACGGKKAIRLVQSMLYRKRIRSVGSCSKYHPRGPLLLLFCTVFLSFWLLLFNPLVSSISVRTIIYHKSGSGILLLTLIWTNRPAQSVVLYVKRGQQGTGLSCAFFPWDLTTYIHSEEEEEEGGGWCGGSGLPPLFSDWALFSSIAQLYILQAAKSSQWTIDSHVYRIVELHTLLTSPGEVNSATP